MFIFPFLVLMGTVLAVNNDQPDVFVFARKSTVQTKIVYVCEIKGFNTSDIILNIKKNHCVLTKEDGVETTGVKPFRNNIYQRRDHVIILSSEVSNYSCEVVHAASRFRVEKVWVPHSVGGRIISSKFIDTTPPHGEMFAENSKVKTNVILTCLVSGFYPNNITVIMKRNGRILTREDGVKSSGVCSYEDDTFQRRDSVEVKKSDESDFSCEVNHAASGSHVKWVRNRQLPDDSGGAGHYIGIITGAALSFIVLVLVGWFKRPILEAIGRYMTSMYKGYIARCRTINASALTKVAVDPQPDKPAAPSDPPSAPTESKSSLNSDNSSNIPADSGKNTEDESLLPVAPTEA